MSTLYLTMHTPDQYDSFLIDAFTSFVKNMYGLGARKIGVTSLPPLGCVPLARTLFGYHEKGCISRFNTDAQQFNKKLNSAAANLQKQHSDLRIVVLDIFKALFHIVKSPSNYGFVEATKGCCGTGTVETTNSCAIRIHQEHVPMRPSMCFGTVSVHLMLLIKSLPIGV
ncbi:GDSL esterase/lipase APG-like [Hibiscus syriacus]|uniref:GDSL esterase/lipase APG-like n=1 Tax=Hibiscus syriacus TaxID=106335 RepID=UPI0019220D6C|nr:GDSL esterase/lipase APG-like [Hibiscus syriacus]